MGLTVYPLLERAIAVVGVAVQGFEGHQPSILQETYLPIVAIDCEQIVCSELSLMGVGGDLEYWN